MADPNVDNGADIGGEGGAELPNGLDRADGIGDRAGTPTPDGAIIIDSPDGRDQITTEESPDSPIIERAEQGTIQHVFTLDWDEGIQQIAVLGRGTILTDSGDAFGEPTVSRVLSARLQHTDKPYTGRLEVVAESLSFDSPPDEFHIEPVEINPSMYKHPRYAILTEEDRNLVRMALESSTLQSQALAAVKAANLTGLNWIVRQLAASELIQKLWKGEETFAMWGMKISWVVFYYRPIPLDPGGRIENPIQDANPFIPHYFWDTTEDNSGSYETDSLFSEMANRSPLLYFDFDNGFNVSWLRQHDEFSYERTFFKLTRTWIGAPFSHWDKDLYSPKSNPYLGDGSNR